MELGFRHLNPFEWYTPVRLTHTEYHWGLVDIVFKSQKSEAIADFLHALTMESSKRPGEMVNICTGHLAGLHNLVPFSPRLRRLVIHFIEVSYYRPFECAEVEKLIELLDHLLVTADEMGYGFQWASLLLDVIPSSKGAQRLSHWYWESLVELVVSELGWLGSRLTDIPGLEVTKSLIEAQEWDKLECWVRIGWVLSESAGITKEDVEHSTLLLLHQRPGATQRLEQWMEKWSQQHEKTIPESFQQILTRAHDVAERQVAP